MTAAEFLAALDTLSWPMTEVARRIGCDPKLPQRWAQGTAQIPPSIERWLAKLAAFHERNPAPTDWRVRK